MPELPEVYHIAQQMNERLRGKRIAHVEILQEKCLNCPPETFRGLILDHPILNVRSRGKWLLTELDGGNHLLISLGMGGDVIYHAAGEEFTGKRQFLFTFDDGSAMHLFFSWFGYVHAADRHGLAQHKMTADLGVCPLSDEFTFECFEELLRGRKGGIKAFLMDQHHVAGIGNVYIQDILYKARLHPNRKINEISVEERRALYEAIRGHLRYAADLGGLVYECDFYGQPGGYTYDLVGHKPGAPCPVCGSPVQEIRTGSTRSYICTQCQK